MACVSRAGRGGCGGKSVRRSAGPESRAVPKVTVAPENAARSSAAGGEKEECGERAALLGLRQAVVEGVPADPHRTHTQDRQDLRPG